MSVRINLQQHKHHSASLSLAIDRLIPIVNPPYPSLSCVIGMTPERPPFCSRLQPPSRCKDLQYQRGWIRAAWTKTSARETLTRKKQERRRGHLSEYPRASEIPRSVWSVSGGSMGVLSCRK